MRHLVDTHGQCQNHDIVLARIDVDAIAIPYSEPLLGYLDYLVAAFTDSEFVVNNVACHVQVTPTPDVHRVAIATGVIMAFFTEAIFSPCGPSISILSLTFTLRS